MLDEVPLLLLGGTLTRLHTDDAFAAASLRAKRTHGRAFDKPAMRDADDATLVRNEIFHVDLGLVRNDLRQARRTVFVAEFAQFLLNDREDALLFCEDIAQIFDSFDEVLVFLVDLFPFEPR